LLFETLGEYADDQGLQVREYRTKKNMNFFTLGLSFLVNL